VTKIIYVTITNLVTPKGGAKHELLFNKLASEAEAGVTLGVTKFIIVTDVI
jgi:hypothetical protein